MTGSSTARRLALLATLLLAAAACAPASQRGGQPAANRRPRSSRTLSTNTGSFRHRGHGGAVVRRVHADRVRRFRASGSPRHGSRRSSTTSSPGDMTWPGSRSALARAGDPRVRRPRRPPADRHLCARGCRAGRPIVDEMLSAWTARASLAWASSPVPSDTPRLERSHVLDLESFSWPVRRDRRHGGRGGCSRCSGGEDDEDGDGRRGPHRSRRRDPAARAIKGNRYDLEMPNVSGLGLWPRPVIVIIGKPRFDKLSSDERAWLAQVSTRPSRTSWRRFRWPTSMPSGRCASTARRPHRPRVMGSAPHPPRRSSHATTPRRRPRFTARAVARIQELKSGSAPAQALAPSSRLQTRPFERTRGGLSGRHVLRPAHPARSSRSSGNPTTR